MTGCTTALRLAITVNPNDLIEQVIGYVSAKTASPAPFPTGPNTTHR